MVDPTFRQCVDLLVKTGYLKNFTDMAMNTLAAFWWSSHEPGEPPVVRGNGSLGVIGKRSRRKRGPRHMLRGNRFAHRGAAAASGVAR